MKHPKDIAKVFVTRPNFSAASAIWIISQHIKEVEKSKQKDNAST